MRAAGPAMLRIAEAGFARLPAAGRRAACGPIPPPAGARTERIKRAETERSGSG